MTPSTDLAAWLLSDDGPIAAREAEGRALLGVAQHTSLELQEPKLLGRYMPGWHSWPDVERLCERVLAECAAQRRIIAKFDTVTEPYDPDYWGALAECIELLAQPYAGRPGWRNEWALPPS